MKTTEEKQLKLNNAIENILLIAEDYDIKQKPFKLSVISDGTITYTLDRNDLYFELNIIADDDFISEETIEDILFSRRIDYIGFNIYRQEIKRIEDLTYSNNE